MAQEGISATKCMTYKNSVIDTEYGDLATSYILRMGTYGSAPRYIDLPPYTSKIMIVYNNGKAPLIRYFYLQSKQNEVISDIDFLLDSNNNNVGATDIWWIYNTGTQIKTTPLKLNGATDN